jgi:hypothetical protein
MDLKRIFKHLIAPQWLVARRFPASTMRAIESAIHDSERLHRGELCFVVEGGLNLWLLLHARTPRARAIEMFSQLRVWDTEYNSGVLIYVQVVDRRIEIVADRGINARVAQGEWDAICRTMEVAFRAQRYEEGAIAGIQDATRLLMRHFPPGGVNPDELPNTPVVL